MKKILKIGSLLLVIIFLFITTGCRNETYVISFDTNGGTIVEDQEVNDKNDKVEKPANPVREGYEFLYWELDGHEYDFDSEVKNSFTLIAKWSFIEKEVELVLNYSGATNMTVTTKNGKIDYIPTREGYEFNGWYYSSGQTPEGYILDTKFDTDTIVKENLTLYAEWVEESKFETQLRAPVVEIIDAVLQWDEILDAMSYIVEIYNRGNMVVNETITNTNYDMSSLSGGYYQIKIQSKIKGAASDNSSYTIKYYAHNVLEEISGISIDAVTSVLSWKAVTNATNYDLYIDNKFIESLTINSFDMSKYDAGLHIVKIVAKRDGYQTSSATSTVIKKWLLNPEYTCFNNIKNLSLMLSWKQVKEANQYIVTINDVTYTTTDLYYEVDLKDEKYKDMATIEIFVQAYDVNNEYLLSIDNNGIVINNHHLVEFYLDNELISSVTASIGEIETVIKNNVPVKENTSLSYWYDENNYIWKISEKIFDVDIMRLYSYSYVGIAGLIFDYIKLTDSYSVGLSEEIDRTTITEMSIPETFNGKNITGIRTSAFSGCSNLISIKIPNSITNIGSYAFEYCSSLKTIDIPNTVTSIGSSAFYRCKALTSITIPFIGESVGVFASNHFGYLFGADGYASNSTYVPTSLKEVIITGGTRIEASAFAGCSSIESIIIPDSVTCIEDGAFASCTALTSIKIPISVEKVGILAFSGCPRLTVYCEVSLKPSGWADMWNYGVPAYWGVDENNLLELDNIYYVLDLENKKASISRCITKEEELKILDNIEYNGTNYAVTSIGAYAFSYCTRLKTVEIPKNIEKIGANAFYMSNSLTIYCEASSQPIGWDSSWSANRPVHWRASESIILELDNINYLLNTEEKSASLYKCNSEEAIIKIPETVEYNGIKYAVTSINKSAFRDCTSILGVKIPDSVTSIGAEAFAGCSNLISVELSKNFKILDNMVFYDCTKLAIIQLPASIEKIASSAFANCENLVIYCELLSQPSEWPILWNDNCPVYWGVDEHNLLVLDNIYYVLDSEKNIAILMKSTSEEAIIKVPDSIEYNGDNYSVTIIGESAFSSCSNLTNIEIPNSVEKIGAFAFYCCTSLISVEIPNNVINIEAGVFCQCSNLVSVKIPNGVTNIGHNAFRYCESLTSIEIPNTVTSIGYEAFSKCTSLTNVKIPISVERIDRAAFGKCMIYCEASSKPNGWDIAWHTYDIPVYWGVNENNFLILDNICYVLDLENKNAILSNCSNQEVSIKIPETVEYNGINYAITSIGAYAFSYCTELKTVEIPRSIKKIGAYAFYMSNSLTIYCEASSQPSEWDPLWNYNIPVIWGYMTQD